MNIEQIYTGCLAQGAYYIESDGEAIIIDPLREPQPYMDRLQRDGAELKYILETHFHADFVSGHLNLSQLTGAPIVFGPTAAPDFDAHIATDGEEFNVGKLTIRVLHTPGHTMESTTYLLLNEQGKEHAIFTGDTLFLGDVGRPDLAQKGMELTMEDLAGTLYDSLRNKIMPLPDTVTVYPAHGAGSACGKNMSKETVGTLGNQKATNYALDASLSKKDFVAQLIDGLEAPPEYFPHNVRLNKSGYQTTQEITDRGLQALSTEQFEQAANDTGAVVLDVRHQSEFVQGFVPRSIFIGIDGGFAPWVGSLIGDTDTPLLLVIPNGREEETVTRLARVGFDYVVGYLDGGFAAWQASGKEIDTLKSITAETFADTIETDPTAHIVDVRKPGEWEAGHVNKASHAPLAAISKNSDVYKSEGTNYIHCAGGYRSVIAASILKSRGIHNVVDVQGGYAAIKKTNAPRVEPVA